MMGIYRQAIEQLTPGAKFSFTSAVESYETIHWKDELTQPTKQQVEAKVAELQPAWDQWAVDRMQAYPSVEEQLDLLWHTINSGQHLLPGCTWFNVIKQAKQSTPKPE